MIKTSLTIGNKEIFFKEGVIKEGFFAFLVSHGSVSEGQMEKAAPSSIPINPVLKLRNRF
jgi:hypothetical protein